MNEVMELKEKLEKALLENILLKSKNWEYRKREILDVAECEKIEKGKTYTSIVELVSDHIIYNWAIPNLYDKYTKEELLQAINEYANTENEEEE